MKYETMKEATSCNARNLGECAICGDTVNSTRHLQSYIEEVLFPQVKNLALINN